MGIPKKIHYCWFGGAQPDEKVTRCMESWRRFCPDWEIVRWDEKNSPLTDNDYVRGAYEKKKWAFVSDYVRLVALCEQGGVYMDTDVELVASPEKYLEHDAVLGFESREHIATCFMACTAGHPVFRAAREAYAAAAFVREDGSLDQTTNVQRMTELLAKHGLEKNNARQTVSGVEIFPSEVFSPKSLQTGKIRRTENTCAIHHFNASWMSPRQRLNTRLAQILGPKLTRWIKGILGK